MLWKVAAPFENLTLKLSLLCQSSVAWICLEHYNLRWRSVMHQLKVCEMGMVLESAARTSSAQDVRSSCFQEPPQAKQKTLNKTLSNFLKGMSLLKRPGDYPASNVPWSIHTPYIDDGGASSQESSIQYVFNSPFRTGNATYQSWSFNLVACLLRQNGTPLWFTCRLLCTSTAACF